MTVNFSQAGQSLIGELSGDKGYIFQSLADQLLTQGVRLVTDLRNNMKYRYTHQH